MLVFFIVLNGVCVYFYCTGRTAFYKDRIVKVSYFNPFGTTLSYDEITEYSVDKSDDFLQLRLKTNSGEIIKVTCGGDALFSGSIAYNGSEYETDEACMTAVDRILKEHKIKKFFNCSYSNFEDLYVSSDEIKHLFEK